jgi:hypothetical protein
MGFAKLIGRFLRRFEVPLREVSFFAPDIKSGDYLRVEEILGNLPGVNFPVVDAVNRTIRASIMPHVIDVKTIREELEKNGISIEDQN